MCLLQLIKPTTEIVESSNTQDLPNLFDHGTLEWGVGSCRGNYKNYIVT